MTQIAFNGIGLEREGGYSYAARVDAILDGLGFDPRAAHLREVVELSGGERGRLALAQQLAAPADVLYDAEAELASLEAALAGPDLYRDAAGARSAGELNATVRRAETVLTDALDRWTDARDALERAADEDPGPRS